MLSFYKVVKSTRPTIERLSKDPKHNLQCQPVWGKNPIGKKCPRPSNTVLSILIVKRTRNDGFPVASRRIAYCSICYMTFFQSVFFLAFPFVGYLPMEPFCQSRQFGINETQCLGGGLIQ